MRLIDGLFNTSFKSKILEKIQTVNDKLNLEDSIQFLQQIEMLQDFNKFKEDQQYLMHQVHLRAKQTKTHFQWHMSIKTLSTIANTVDNGI